MVEMVWLILMLNLVFGRLVFGSKLNYTYTCSTESTLECDNTVLSCLSNEPCYIYCGSPGSCENTVIDCGNSSYCGIACNSTDSCSNATVFGQDAQYVYLEIWTSFFYSFFDYTPNSCVSGTRIFCPYSNITSEAQSCEINCRDNGFREACDNMTIFVVEGMNDMVIHDFDGQNMMQNVYIRCGLDFGYYCEYGMLFCDLLFCHS